VTASDSVARTNGQIWRFPHALPDGTVAGMGQPGDEPERPDVHNVRHWPLKMCTSKRWANEWT
jgi:hypothetical protein